jgi:hypothetical protein
MHLEVTDRCNQMRNSGLTRSLAPWLRTISIGQTWSAAFLTVILIHSIVCGFCNTVQGQGFIYNTNTGTVTVTGYNGPNGNVTIPVTLAGLPVTSIGPYAFYQKAVASVLIPDTVTNIGEHAFDQCFFLNRATIPDGVYSIGDSSFYQCFRMTNLTIGANLTNIGSYSFTGCTGLLTIDVNSNNLAYYSSSGVLFDLTQSKLLLFPPGVGGGYTIPNTTKSIGFQAFLQCSGLTNIDIPNGITNIEDEAFDQCGALNSVHIPDSVRAIGNDAFNSCYGLTSADIGNGVALLGANVFMNCFSLTSVTIGSNLTALPVSWVNGCVNLTAITVDPLNPAYSSLEGVLFNKDQTALILCPPRKAGTYDIPTTVTGIGIAAFGYCTNLTNVTIPDSVTNIANSAFYSCANLTSITIPGNVAAIGGAAFSLCSSLTNVIVGTNVSYLGGDVFSQCFSLTAVHFEGPPPSADSTAFDYDGNVVIYYLPGVAGWGSTFAGRPTEPWTAPPPINPPQLSLFSNASDAILAWPTNATGFSLQSTTNLGSPVWITNSSAPVVVNGQNTVTNPISGSQQFFRLSQ